MAVKGILSGKPILDTGPTQTMFKDRSSFARYAPKSTLVKVADGDAVGSQGVGTVEVTHLGSPLTFCKALHVPSLKTDLVSMTELADKGCSIVFKEGGLFEVIQDTDVVFSGELVDGLMELDVKPGKSPPLSTALVTQADSYLLHSRLQYPVPVPFSKAHPGFTASSNCKPCILAKHNQLPCSGKSKRGTERLELLHRNPFSWITSASLSGKRYYFMITDIATS